MRVEAPFAVGIGLNCHPIYHRVLLPPSHPPPAIHPKKGIQFRPFLLFDCFFVLFCFKKYSISLTFHSFRNAIRHQKLKREKEKNWLKVADGSRASFLICVSSRLSQQIISKRPKWNYERGPYPNPKSKQQRTRQKLCVCVCVAMN